MPTFTSPFQSVGAIPELTLPEFIVSNPYKVSPSRKIIIEGGGERTMTFQDYCDAIKDAASGVRVMFPHLQEGDMVGLLSTNTLEYPSLALGISGSGMIPALVNPSATPAELAHSFKLVAPDGLKVLFCHPALLDGALEGIKLAGFAQTPRIVSMLPDGARGYPTVLDLLARGKRNPHPLATLKAPAAESLAFIYYSSGTTGAFKGVMLSHRNMVSNTMQVINSSADLFTPSAIMVSFLPLYHIYGAILSMLCCPASGTTNVLLDKFEPELFLGAIQKHKVTHAPIVPPIAVMLAKSPIVDSYDLSSLRVITIAAAPTKLDLVQQLRRRLNVKVVQGYGMTEASPGTHSLPPEHEAMDGSVGFLNPNMECRLIDDDGKEVGIEEEGEIVLRGPNIMLGYYRNPEATKETVRDGWLYTGDVGRRNKDGFYWIVDRKKELIKVRGFQVAPAELEGILLSSPLVLDCAVTAAYDDEKATEVPRAFVVVDPKNRNDATAKEIQSFVDKQVAHYKRLLGGVIFLDEIPKNPSGKILRRLLPRDAGTTHLKAKL